VIKLENAIAGLNIAPEMRKNAQDVTERLMPNEKAEPNPPL
jgi:hypothetical protein